VTPPIFPVLTGYGVRLEPLLASHAPALAALVDADMFRWMSAAPPDTVEAMTGYVDAALADPGRAPYAVLVDGEVVGSTSYYDVCLEQARLEVGHTFYARRCWGTRVNPACKRLLLGHAFDALGCARIALRTDVRNIRSQAAIERLGALREGVLRSHQYRPDGTRRDTVYFSVLAEEWPRVRAGLDARLAD